MSRKNKGFSTLILTLVVLLSVTLISFMSANSVITSQTITQQAQKKNVSFNAAQAGLNYAIPYLNVNYATVSDGDSVQVNLSGGGMATVTFELLSGTELIRITSVGYSAGGNNPHTVRQLVQFKGDAAAMVPAYVTQARGNVVLVDNGIIADTTGNAITARTGGTAIISGSAYTLLDSGVSSTSGGLNGDVVENDSALDGSDSNFQNKILGQTLKSIKDPKTDSDLPTNAGTLQGTYVYDYNDGTFAPYSGSDSYSITQENGEAQMKGSTELGTSSNPIQLVVNLEGTYTLPGGTVKSSEFQMRQDAKIYGDLVVNGNALFVQNVVVTGEVHIRGNLTLVDGAQIDGSVIVEGNVLLLNTSKINGAIYATGDIHVTNQAEIQGAVISQEGVRVSQNGKITYDSSQAKFYVSPGTSGSVTVEGGYGRVPGSWIDLAGS